MPSFLSLYSNIITLQSASNSGGGGGATNIYNSNNNVIFYSLSNNGMSNERMRFAGPYLGVGTATPPGALGVVGPTSSSNSIINVANSTINAEASIGFNTYNGWNAGNRFYIGYNAVGLTNNGFNIGNAAYSTPALTCSSINNNYVGVNQAVPQEMLHMTGGLLVLDSCNYPLASSGRYMVLGTPSNIFRDRFPWKLHMQSNQFSTFTGMLTANAYRGTFVGMHDTGSTKDLALMFSDEQNAAMKVIWAGCNYSNGTGVSDMYEVMRVTGFGNMGLSNTNPGYQLHLSKDSAAKPGTSTWTISSDERLKENIVLADLSRCYDIVKNIPLKFYTWKEDVYSTDIIKDRSKLGWIAQDVELVFPKAVGTTDFAHGYSNVKDLNSDQLYAAMYGCIQHMQTKLEALESKVSQLSGGV